MFAVFLLSLAENLRLIALCIRHLGSAGVAAVPRRLLTFGIGLPLFLTLTGLHWLGFAVDALLFRGDRRIAVTAPVFIVGIPRSGTTYLHRLLAGDGRLTSLAAWEAVLAPSISERYLWGALGRLLAPLAAWTRDHRPGWLARFDRIHTLDPLQPEEDFLLLLPLSGCLLLALVFPRHDRFWDLAYFDRAVPAWHRRAMLHWYRRCVQKHLYVHGPGKRFLAKNPSFSPMLRSLSAAFPDAVYVVCGREPQAAVASQLSAVTPFLHWLGENPTQPVLRERLLAMLAHYFADVLAVDRHCVYVTHDQIRDDLLAVCQRLHAALGLPPTPARQAWLGEEAKRNRRYRSGHTYDLARFGLDAHSVHHRFGASWLAFRQAAGEMG